MAPRLHLALYGNTAIVRRFCTECEGYAFVLDGVLACCDKPVDKREITKIKRISDCVERRRHFVSRKKQVAILEAQQGCCFYCDRHFGTTVFSGQREIALRIQWDHVNPFTYSLDNRDQNFVAACHICNNIKAALIFKSVDEARTFIVGKWEERGISSVSPAKSKIRLLRQPQRLLESVGA